MKITVPPVEKRGPDELHVRLVCTDIGNKASKVERLAWALHCGLSAERIDDFELVLIALALRDLQ